jgi:octaprenyl-diphosphate synthase
LPRRSIDDPAATSARYWRIIELKTAELFEASCVVGAELAGHPAPFVHVLGEFGRRLGRAYQIYDDLTDFAGSNEEAGKTLGTDLASGKVTLPLQLLGERLPPEARRALLEALGNGQPSAWSVAVTQMRDRGVFEEVALTVKREIAAAEAHLAACDGVECAHLLMRLSSALKVQVDHLLARNTG